MAGSEIAWPLSTAPGSNPTESGGRIINLYVEKAPDGSRSKFIWRRLPGLVEAFVTLAGHRGALPVGNVLYVVSDDTVYTVTYDGTDFTVTALTGDAVPGTGKVTMDRNMATNPDIVIVTDSGMSLIDTSGGTVADYTDADLPAPNSVTFLDAYFFFGIGDGRCFASGINATTVNANDFARAEKSPDELVRVVRYGSYLAMFGSKTTEFWSNTGNPTGFPLSFSTVIPFGLLTPFAVAGYELGFARGLGFVASDRTVQLLEGGFAPRKISTPDLDRLLSALADVTELEMSVYVSKGHSFLVLSCDAWTWEFRFGDAFTAEGWEERKSYLQNRWRATMGVNAFDMWLTFSRSTDQVFRIDHTVETEDEQPLVAECRSVQQHAFPSRLEVTRAAFDFEPGVGLDDGVVDPKVLLSYSDNGGRTFGEELERRLGSEGEMVLVEIGRCGTTGPRGRQWRWRQSDAVELAFYGAAMEGEAVG